MLVCGVASWKLDTWPNDVIIAQPMEQQAENKLLTKCFLTFILLIIAQLAVTLWLFGLPGFNKPEIKDNFGKFHLSLYLLS